MTAHESALAPANIDSASPARGYASPDDLMTEIALMLHLPTNLDPESRAHLEQAALGLLIRQMLPTDISDFDGWRPDDLSLEFVMQLLRMRAAPGTIDAQVEGHIDAACIKTLRRLNDY